MNSTILVHPDFDGSWPFAADHLHALWHAEGAVEFIRLPHGDKRPAGEILERGAEVSRLALLGVLLSEACLSRFGGLRELGLLHAKLNPVVNETLKARNVAVYSTRSEGFWGQSVSEYGLALTLCGLRRIPQDHHAIQTNQAPWNYSPEGGRGTPGKRGHQFGDDANFSNGTLCGKRVRVVGAGNIASRYASFCHSIGADVAAWDPFASEPCFHRAGARREQHLERLVQDAEIFAPMVPLNDSTRGIVTAAHIDALPKGCLVVLVTRAMICDMEALRRRVLKDELALAADVFDVEPLPLNDPLLGRHNVVHTPHNAGRTKEANFALAQHLAEQFRPVGR